MSVNSICTGGHRQRQGVRCLNMPGRSGLYGPLGQKSDELDAGGPLDAPETLPAGSTSSAEWRNFRGEPIARQTEVDREQ